MPDYEGHMVLLEIAQAQLLADELESAVHSTYFDAETISDVAKGLTGAVRGLRA